MRKTTFHGIFFLLFFINTGISQHKNILECMQVIGFDADQSVIADIDLKWCDTIVDLKSGYFELNYAFGGDTKYKICQVAKFNNTDGTILIGITGYYADEQCSNYPSTFYEISKSEDLFTPLEIKTILPSLDFHLFFIDPNPIQILEKYLPEIKDKYLGSEATLEDILNEVYDYRIIIPRKGTTAKVTLTVCDYIPLNEVSINRDDWSVVEENIRVVEFAYDRDKKQFMPMLNE
ncbi:MAG: hypothetical protein AAGI49_03270 [Bacteroidota bacterium]